jgi:hypothetical protein
MWKSWFKTQLIAFHRVSDQANVLLTVLEEFSTFPFPFRLPVPDRARVLFPPPGLPLWLI